MNSICASTILRKKLDKELVNGAAARHGIQRFAGVYQTRSLPLCAAVPHVGKSHRRDRLRGWAYRIRTSMCKVKILLFEKSQRFGFAQASADPCASQENNLLCGGWIACRSHAPSSSGAPSGPGPLAHRSSNLLRRQCRILRHCREYLLLASSAMIAPAAAQQGQPNPAQAAAKALLQAADKAIGASNVKSSTVTATGWMGSPGQQFAQGDLPRGDLKS